MNSRSAISWVRARTRSAPGSSRPESFSASGANAVLELRQVLGRGLADVLLQRDHRVADQVGQALRGPARTSIDGWSWRRATPIGLKALLVLRASMACWPATVTSRPDTLSLMSPADEQGRDQVAHGVLRPAERGAAEVRRAGACRPRCRCVDVVTDADHRLVVGADGRVAAGDLHQAERIELGRDGPEVARPGAQELLRHGGIDPLRRFRVAVEDLLRGGAAGASWPLRADRCPGCRQPLSGRETGRSPGPGYAVRGSAARPGAAPRYRSGWRSIP